MSHEIPDLPLCEPTSSLLSPSVLRIVEESIALEEESAKKAGALGYMARSMVQATIPHRKPKEAYFERKNGKLTLTMSAPSKIGLPYGTKPRLLLFWLTTEAVQKRERTIILGDSLSEFMGKLGLTPTGGPRGSITSLKDQMKKLFACSISCVREDERGWGIHNLQIATKTEFWWDPQEASQRGFWNSILLLNEDFFQTLISRPVPIDTRVLRLIRQSPMAIDVYSWLVYRLSYLNKQTVIPWESLQMQFGADLKRLDHFKYKFRCALHKTCAAYPNARVELTSIGLKLSPSKLHIAR